MRITLLLLLISVALVGRADEAAAPAAQITVPCKVIEVYDGDTVTVRVTMDLRVRLLDCWAPEIRTKDAAEKVLGLAARDHLRELAEGKEGLLQIPIADMSRFDDAITLGRVLGRIIVDGVDASDAQVKAGHAHKSKQSANEAQ